MFILLLFLKVFYCIPVFLQILHHVFEYSDHCINNKIILINSTVLQYDTTTGGCTVIQYKK